MSFSCTSWVTILAPLCNTILLLIKKKYEALHLASLKMKIPQAIYPIRGWPKDCLHNMREFIYFTLLIGKAMQEQRSIQL